jgi:hypothetical protein
MQRANRAFRLQRLDEALRHYDQALALVDALLDGGRPCVGLLMARIVSHQNRANARLLAGRPAAAEDDHRAAYLFARAVADDAHMPTELRRAACRRSRACMAEWRYFRGARDGPRTDRGARPPGLAVARQAPAGVLVH